MIRPAEPKDGPSLVRMGHQFYAGIPTAKLIDIDTQSLVKIFAATNEHMQVFVMEEDGEVVGTVAGVVYPFLFNQGKLVAQELFWWIDPEHRKGLAGRNLHKHLEDWARECGATAIFMIAIENDCAQKVEKIYNRYGYEKTEHTFMKEL